MLEATEDKILSGARLNRADALELFESEDLFTIGSLASVSAEARNGRNAYFIINRHINPTNICVNRCKFCAFSRSKGEDGAFELTTYDVISRLEASFSCADPMMGAITEVHIVGGLHPEWPF